MRSTPSDGLETRAPSTTSAAELPPSSAIAHAAPRAARNPPSSAAVRPIEPACQPSTVASHIVVPSLASATAERGARWQASVTGSAQSKLVSTAPDRSSSGRPPTAPCVPSGRSSGEITSSGGSIAPTVRSPTLRKWNRGSASVSWVLVHGVESPIASPRGV